MSLQLKLKRLPVDFAEMELKLLMDFKQIIFEQASAADATRFADLLDTSAARSAEARAQFERMNLQPVGAEVERLKNHLKVFILFIMER